MDENARRNPRIVGDDSKFDEPFKIVSAIITSLLFGRVIAARQLCEQLDASLKRIE